MQVTISVLFSLKCTRNRLAAGLRLSLSAPPGPLAVLGGRGPPEGRGRDGRCVGGGKGGEGRGGGMGGGSAGRREGGKEGWVGLVWVVKS